MTVAAAAAPPAAAGPRFRDSPRDRAGALARAAAAEFIGTLLFAAIAALLAATLPGVLADALESGVVPPLWVTGAADAAALVVAAAVIGPFSGAYLNGAAVWAAVLAGDVSVLRGVLYGAAQAAAATLAAALLPAPALDPAVWKDLVPPRIFGLPAPATAAAVSLLVGVLKTAVFAWATVGVCRALASAGKGKAAPTATAASAPPPPADLRMPRARALAMRGAVAFLLHVLLPRHPGGPLDLLRLRLYEDGAPATEYRAGLWLHVAAVAAGATVAGVAAWRLRLRLGRPAAADKAAVANGKVALAADAHANGANGHVGPRGSGADAVPWADYHVVSSMVGVLAVSVLQRAVVNMVLEGAGVQIICALTSPLFLVGRGYGCAGPVFNKLEEWLFMVVLNSASLTSVILVWRALAKPTAAAAPPRDPRPRWLLALHVLWLVVHVAMENTFPRGTGGHWLCTWSWWSTALHCTVRLAEAVGPARLRERQVSSISFAASYGELMWTHTTFLVGPVNQPIDILIHVLPLVYMNLAAVLDESGRTGLPLRQAVRRAVLVGSLTYAYNLLYCWLFDYHFFYDRMFESAHPTKWWAIMETNVMASTAAAVYLLLNCQLSEPAARAAVGKDGKGSKDSNGGGAAAAAAAAWAGRAWARAWRFAVCLAVVLLVPGTMLLTIPTRPVMAHNCPAPPRILARRDRATSRIVLDPDGVAHGFPPDGVPSLFVHAMVGNDYAALSEAFGALTKMFLVDELYQGCAPIELPAELVDLNRGGDAAEAIWVWTATLPRAHHNFGLITISDWQGLLRTGTIVVLIAPWQATKDAAAGAALALAPSANVFLPALPQTPQGARDLLSLLERAAQVARMAPGLRAERAAAPEPAGEGCLVLSPTNTGDLPRGRCPHPHPDLGRVALVARYPPPGAALVTEDGQRSYCLGDAFRGMLQQQLPPEMAARLGCAVTSMGAYQLGEASFTPVAMENARWQTLTERQRVPYIMYQFPHYLLPAKRSAARGGGDLTWDDLVADLGAVLNS